MKRIICILIACIMLLVFGGCAAGTVPIAESGGENDAPADGRKTVISPGPENSETNTMPATNSETENASKSESSGENAPFVADSAPESVSTPENSGENPALAAQTPEAKSGVDVDLTLLSSTMIYAEVSNMMLAPERYIGKTVKMRGQFAIYPAVDESGQPIPDKRYFACVIADATACCAQGLEFVLAGEHAYPDDYPEPSTLITVVGTFDTYEEYGYLYCQLTHAALVDG